MKYYLGIDAGGTKTRFARMNEQGQLEKETVLESCHLLQVPEEKARAILENGLKQVLPEDGEAFLAAGMAGYGKDRKLRKKIEELCASVFSGIPFALYSDAEIALSGALAGEDGILVIAGTGSIALAEKDGQFERCGGWGYQLGDEGSSYWIGRQLLNAYTRQCDGRMQPTLLKQRIREMYGLEDDYDLISRLNPDRTAVASLARLGSRLVQEQDPAARKIFEEGAGQLAELANTLARDFNGPVPVALTGGLWNAGDFFRKAFESRLDSRLHVEDNKHDPVTGACLLAKALDASNKQAA